MSKSSLRPQGRNILTTLSLMVLIGVEVFAVAISGAWAVAGLFEFGSYLSYVLAGAFGLLALWLMVQLWRKATSVDLAR